MTKEKTTLNGERTLIVDDIPKWLQTTKNNLKYYGCKEMITAMNPEEAFKKYSEKDPSLIITDINFNTEDLGDVQGLELISLLRKEGYTKPLLAMSSLEGEIEGRAKELGADYFIDKKNFVNSFDGFVRWYIKKKKYELQYELDKGPQRRSSFPYDEFESDSPLVFASYYEFN